MTRCCVLAQAWPPVASELSWLKAEGAGVGRRLSAALLLLLHHLHNVLIRRAPKKKQEKSLKWQHGSLPVLWFRPQGHTSCHHCHCCELNNLTVARHPPLAGGSQCFTDTHNKEPHVHVHFYPLWFILNISGAVRPNVCNQWALQKDASLKTHPQWCEVWLWCASSLGGPLHQPTMPNTHQFYFHIS